MSCAQIKVTGSGTGNPAKVSIPGYIKANGTSYLFLELSTPSLDLLILASPS